MQTHAFVAATVVLAALLASGCGSIPLPTRGLHGVDPAPSLGRKLVTGKEPPVTLIAEDGTRCLTSRDRFERTRIGSEVWCVWTGGGAEAGPTATLER
jgi:hypothetical protein